MMVILQKKFHRLEQRANPFENVFSKTAVFPPPAIAETDL